MDNNEIQLRLDVISQAQVCDKCPIQIDVYDDSILFCPITPFIEKELTIVECSLECNPKKFGKRETVRRKRTMFEKIPRNGKIIGATFPGFLKRLQQCILKNRRCFKVLDMRRMRIGMEMPAPRFDLMYAFRFSQENLVVNSLLQDKSGLIGAPTRYGKCLSINELCMMHDYTIKKSQELALGDKLMGPDGKPREITALVRGEDESYRIIPNKGEPFSCTGDHVLVLTFTGNPKFGGYKKGDIVTITVKDYLTKSKTYKHCTKLLYQPLAFEEKNLPIDPWVVGVWIGDGCKDGSSYLNKPDLDVQAGLIKWAEVNGYVWKYTTRHKLNDVLKINIPKPRTPLRQPSAFLPIAKMCVINDEKRIPLQYLTASRRQRLELLAGLIDTDGYCNNGLGFEISTKYEGLAEDIVRLCRGLGFRCTRTYKKKRIKSYNFEGYYWRLQISGALEEVPCRGHKKIHHTVQRANPNVTGFKVEAIGVQPYYGVEVNGPDNKFLMWDHLVTHNSSIIANIIRAFPTLPAVVAAPGVDLCKQMYNELSGKDGTTFRKIEGREVKFLKNANSKQSEYGVTVCSIDSLHHCDPGITKLLIVDEAHASVTDSRLQKVQAFNRARRYGIGATLEGRFDKRDLLIEGLFGPVLTEITYLDAVKEGAICPLHVLFYKVKLDPDNYYRSRDDAYDELFFKSPEMAELTNAILDEVVPQDFQTLVFIHHEEQADLYMQHADKEAKKAMAKCLTESQRKKLDEDLKANIIKRCFCSKIYVQGVTFSDVRVLINADAGGNNTTAIQKPGRLAQVRPNKKCGIVIDFKFEPADGSANDYAGEEWVALCRDSNARMKAYKDKGYEITEVNSIEELKAEFNKLI